MTLLRRLALTCAVLVALSLSFELAAPRLEIPLPTLIGEAEARVGRPATPVSVAGAGRRTVRRCAAGVYNC